MAQLTVDDNSLTFCMARLIFPVVYGSHDLALKGDTTFPLLLSGPTSYETDLITMYLEYLLYKNVSLISNTPCSVVGRTLSLACRGQRGDESGGGGVLPVPDLRKSK